MNVKEILVEMGGSAQIWLQTIPVNAQGNIWEETASTVSTYSFLWMLPCLSHFFSLSPSSGLCIKRICDSSEHLFHRVHGEACKNS